MLESDNRDRDKEMRRSHTHRERKRVEEKNIVYVFCRKNGDDRVV